MPEDTKYSQLTLDLAALNVIEQAELEVLMTTHTADSNAHHPANNGLTGTRTIAGYTLTFTNGLLTGFTAP